MKRVLTLIVNPGHESDLLLAAKKCGDYLRTIGDNILEQALQAGEALDLIWDGKAASIDILTDILSALPVDWALQLEASREKKLFLADMDSTMITVECIDELADFVGLKQQVSEVTEAAMRGELDFVEALTERVALLKGLKQASLQTCYDERVQFSEGAATLLATLKSEGIHTVLVSGGFTFFTERVKEELGFLETIANRLELSDGALTGKVIPPICDSATKLNTLQDRAAKLGVTAEQAIAVGDGANDIPMIEVAGLGVAYRAIPKTNEAAAGRISHTNLTSILYMMGVPKARWQQV